MIVLGINGGVRGGYQDISAALVVDGQVIAAIEEERLSRVKHAPGQLPERAIRLVLDRAGVAIEEVDVVATHGITWGDTYHEVLRRFMADTFGACPAIERVSHHDAHAASTYFASGFDDAVILTADNSGDGVSTQLAVGRAGEIETIESFERPNSLGMFYSMMSQFCGFRRDSEEYKFMGLSAYGDPAAFDWDWLLEIGDGSYCLNTDYLIGISPGTPSPHRQQMLFSDLLTGRIGPARRYDSPITRHYEDVAASVQRHLESVLVVLVERLCRDTGIGKLCLSGGVALNCAANRVLMNLDCVDALYVQPASQDAGVSLGAAWLVGNRNGDVPVPIPHVYIGKEFSHGEIEAALKLSGAAYRSLDDPAAWAAEQVAAGRVIGWFQGRDEFGPRALGNRSILAPASDPGIKDRINDSIKFREAFRPYCPSVLEEDAPDWFDGGQAVSPFMTVAYDASAAAKDGIPGVIHHDGTARIQTVNGEQNPLFYRYLSELKGRTGIGVSLNTSFNVRGQPIVHSPADALGMFFSGGLEGLVVGPFGLSKDTG